MAVPSVNFSVEEAVSDAIHSSDDVVYLVGTVSDPAGDAPLGNFVPGQVYAGRTIGDFTDGVGTSGPLFDCLDKMLARVNAQTYVSVYTTKTDSDSDTTNDNAVDKNAADLTASIIAALNEISQVPQNPTVIAVAGNEATLGAGITGDDISASTIAARMSALAEQLSCRAVAASPQDTITKAISWGGNNTGPYLMGVFNSVGPSSAREFPTGPWLGSTLSTSVSHGRAWGINFASVIGVTGVEHQINAHDANLVNLDAAGISTIVLDEGLLKIIGDEFKNGETDPTRFWGIARVVDYVERTLISQARGYISSTYSANRQAIKLTQALNAVTGAGEILGGSVVPDLDRTQGLAKYFIADLDLLYATNQIHIRLRFGG